MADFFFSGAAAALAAHAGAELGDEAEGLGPGGGVPTLGSPGVDAEAGVIAGSSGMPRPGVALPIGPAGPAP